LKPITGLKILLLFFLYLTLNSCLLYSYDPFNEYKKNLENKYEKVNDYNFWIKHISKQKKILLNYSQIQELNHRIRSFADSTNNIFANFTEKDVYNKINRMFQYLFRKQRYFKSGLPVGKDFFQNIASQFNIKNINSILSEKRFAVIKKRAFLRTLPTDIKILDFRLLEYFNRNIETITHINELVRILNVSLNGKWYFIASKYSFGWIKSENLQKVENTEKYFGKMKKFCVILNDNVTEHNLKLGDILPVANNKIVLPDNGQISLRSLDKKDYSIGFLPFTKKNILKLVFNLIKSPYGWGGLGNRRDCSLFIMDIFRCFGINLPRNSWKQSEVLLGFRIAGAKNKDEFIVKNGAPLTSIIYKKGHVMLYMGSVNGKTYIAHAFNMKDYHRGEILVTDLDFGRPGFSSSLLKLLYISR
jgi:hypothetical protein